MPYPPYCEDAIVEDERRQEIADLIDEATHPYKRCLEEIHGQAVYFRDRIARMRADDPDNRQLRGAHQVARMAVENLDRWINEYGLRDELDL